MGSRRRSNESGKGSSVLSEKQWLKREIKEKDRGGKKGKQKTERREESASRVSREEGRDSEATHVEETKV